MRLYRDTAQAVLALSLAFLVPLRAEDHIVPSSELHREVASAARARQQNLARIEEFFSSGRAGEVLKKAHMDAGRVRQAVAMLSDEEIAGLALHAQKAQADIAAGSLSNQELTYIVIALATAVLILVIVAAR